MANLIQIKRSTTTAVATGLANGEFAYTANGDVLFIGSNGGVVAIGGARTPGVLTANQALVANATSGIDKVIVANLVSSHITANGVVSPGDGYYLAVDAGGNTYWAAPGTLAVNADAQYVWTNTHTFLGSVTVGNTTVNTALTNGSIVIGTSFVANTSRVKIGTSTGLDANGSIGTAGQVLTSNGTTVYWQSLTADITSVVAGAGLTGGGTTGDVTLDIGAGDGITVAADSISVDGANGISVDASGVNVLAGTDGGLSVNSTGVWVVAGSGLLTNSTGTHVGSGNGISTAADAVYVTGGSTITVNATGVHVNTANLAIATSQLTGDVALGTQTSGNYVATITAGAGISGSSSTEGGTPTIAVVANNGIVANSTGVFAKAANGISVDGSGINVVGGEGLISNSTGVHVIAGNGISTAADSVYVNGGSTLTVNSTGAHVNTNLSITSLSLSGDLVVAGNVTTTTVNSIKVSDPLIYLAGNNNVADTLDIGFAGQYYDGAASRWTGLFRDHGTNNYRLFANTTQDLSGVNDVDTGAVGYTMATLYAYLNTGALVSNSAAVTITANSTVNVNITANSLTLSTPLAVTSGGLGLSSITAGAILVGNNGGPATVLAAATNGYVLQSNGTSVVYGTLDGGTF